MELVLKTNKLLKSFNFTGFYFFLGTAHQVTFCVIARKSRFDGSDQSRKINTSTMHA